MSITQSLGEKIVLQMARVLTGAEHTEQIEEILLIAFGSGNRRGNDSFAGQPQGRAEIADGGYCFLLCPRVANDSPPADLPRAQFKLRLDQRDNPDIGAKQRQQRWNQFGQGDKRCIEYRQVERPVDLARGHITTVEPLPYDNPPIASQFPVQDTVADINCINNSRAALQQTIGEPPG